MSPSHTIELGPEDVSLLERCPHFRGCYVQGPVIRILQKADLDRLSHSSLFYREVALETLSTTP